MTFSGQTNPPPVVRVTEIGEYIRYQSCDRRFKLGFNNRYLATQLPFAARLFNTIDPVLQEAGRQRENAWEVSLQNSGLLDLTQYAQRPEDDRATTWNEFVHLLATLTPGQSAYGREISIDATLGAFRVNGQMDFVVVSWNNQEPIIRIVECKASRRDKTYHRIQVCLYRMLVRQYLQAHPLYIGGVLLDPQNIECVVARINAESNESQAILALLPLDLDTEEDDITRLISPNGRLIDTVNSDLAHLNYQIESKCDDCVFSVHCLSESARQRRMELLSLEPSTIRALQIAGIQDIDNLAELDLESEQALQIRQDPSFSENLETLQLKARSRRRTLPGGGENPDEFPVTSLPNTGHGQLPEHVLNGERLIRVYLSVEYDYVENRVGALAAHITKSDAKIYTPSSYTEDGVWQPNPDICEQLTLTDEVGNEAGYEERPLQGENVIQFKRSEWTGDYNQDTGAERELIQAFLMELVDRIASVASTEQAPIHFYVWSRAEMVHLVEGCSRASSYLLGNLRQLLGCRESLEQLLFSCLQQEVENRYALGWTGRGLSVVTSLRWFGQGYHWYRRISGATVRLDDAFTQDIFDFKTNLSIDDNGNWVTEEYLDPISYKFEIRSRFSDSLTAPYWRAYWRTLPNPTTVSDPKVGRAIERYNNARSPGYLESYLRERVHALRWIEERIRFKNSEIGKPSLLIAELPDFRLGVNDSAQAAIDFLRLDQHVKVTNWIANHLVPPIYRITRGRTIPVRNVTGLGTINGEQRLTATIDSENFGISYEAFRANCTIEEGSFVRLSPSSLDPHNGQTIGQLLRAGSTCIVDSINWDSREISLSVRPYTYEDRYRLRSRPIPEVGPVFETATLDESPSDFVAPRVDSRLNQPNGNHVYHWFDPENPQIPQQQSLAQDQLLFYRELLESLPLPPNNRNLADDQITAILDGLSAKIQLLQGPPGTGKTATTAVATLLKILARRTIHRIGNRYRGDIVLIAANTHTAVNNLLQRIDTVLPNFIQHASTLGFTVPPIQLSKVHTSQVNQEIGGNVVDFVAKPCATNVKNLRDNRILVIGGTTSSLLKMAEELSNRQPFSNDPNGFQVSTLIVDEASMIVFPHFLSLATLVSPDGEIMLAGDHRQLSPIVSHDWEREDRPPVIIYQPYASAYQAVLDLRQRSQLSNRSLVRSSLSFTFRLPVLIRNLIARLYLLDDIQLQGPVQSNPNPEAPDAGINGTWESVWQGYTGLYLVLHNEQQSKRSNLVEANIIHHILSANEQIPNKSVAIVTPHRAQRSLLKTTLLGAFGDFVHVIDTVERLQGGECPTIIVSATASDPNAISKNVEFILDLNRSNVAFSRTQRRLIVVCSETLLDHVPADYEHYESTMLWKYLRSVCSQLIATENVDNHQVRIFTPSPDDLNIDE